MKDFKSTSRKKLEIIGVYDNESLVDGLIPGWGFSAYISLGEKAVLFDVGADLKILQHNLKQLDISPKNLDAIILSHPHCDHVGGLSAILKKNANLPIYLTDSFPASLEDKIYGYGAKSIRLYDPEEIYEGIYSTGEMMGTYKGSELPEQSLIVETKKGPVVVTGCAHPGVINIVEKIEQITQQTPHLVLGGFHLSSKKGDEVERIIEQFRRNSVDKLAPSHCTGKQGKAMIQEAYGDKGIEFGAGGEVKID